MLIILLSSTKPKFYSMKKLVLLCISLFCVGSYSAQSSNEKTKRIELKKTHESVQVKTTSAEDSPFFGNDNKIKELLLKENSIELVPQRKTAQSKADYLNTLNAWIKSNPLLIKPDKRNVEIN